MTRAGTTKAETQYRLAFADEIQAFTDIAITDANKRAIAAVRLPEAWQSPVMCLIGPVRCGLGVIGRLWAKEADGQLVSARAFDEMHLNSVEALLTGNCVLDLAEEVTREDHLLALLNLPREQNSRVLLTARTSPAVWKVKSADLKSRLSAVPVVEIYPPDEEMLELRLLASCKRRFILLNDVSVKYLRIRLPRSYVAIEDYVSRLDAAIETTGRRPSLQLVREVFEDGASSYKLFDDSLE